jgi:HK97 family phage portal protein
MSLLSLFGMGSRESLSPAPWNDYWYGPVGTQTAAGVRVDEQVAMNYSVCWAATRLLAGTTGWLPFNLYKRLPSGGANVATDHPVHRLIHDQPNTEMGAMMFRSRGVNHQVNWGNCYAEIRRTKGGMPYDLFPIHPSRIPNSNIKRENGRLVYYVRSPDGGNPEPVAQENMFHVPSIISDDGVIGKGVVTAAREAIGRAMGTQTRGSAALKNGGAPPMAIKGGKFKDKAEREEYRRQLDEIHGRPENAGKLLLLPPDSEVQMLGFNLHDSQFIESQQFDVEDLCRWYGVPPHLVQNLLRATFNNIEELGISFVKYSLIQWLKLWEQEVWRKLLTPAEQQTHYAKFVVDALERGNMQSRTEANVKKFFNGHWTLNQWAEQEDENPVTETTVIDGQTVNLGDVRFVQQAMIPLALAAKGPAQQNQTDGAGPAQQNPTDELRTRMDTYGVGVRAGAITPQTDDEDHFREQAGLPAMSAEAKAAWQDDEGVRHPITLRDPNAAPSPFGQPPQPPQDDPAKDDNGLSAIRDQLAASKAAQKQLAAAMLNDVMARMVSLEVNAVKRVAEKASKFDSRLREFYEKHKLTMERSLRDPLYSLYVVTEPAYRALASTVADDHIKESLRQLDALTDCTADELPAKVDECVSKWHDERATVTV